MRKEGQIGKANIPTERWRKNGDVEFPRADMAMRRYPSVSWGMGSGGDGLDVGRRGRVSDILRKKGYEEGKRRGNRKRGNCGTDRDEVRGCENLW